MGMDVSGKNPVLRSEKPEWPKNWNKLSDKAKNEYFRLNNEFRKNNPGDYFRSNCWGWRPIVSICEMVDVTNNLDIDFTGWHYNDGMGLNTQEECTKLADALEEACEEIFEKSEVDTFQICMGSWVTLEGKFVSNKIQESLNNEYPYGTTLTSPVVTSDGTIVESSHSIDKKHLQQFISFLRECGGFEIW